MGKGSFKDWCMVVLITGAGAEGGATENLLAPMFRAAPVPLQAAGAAGTSDVCCGGGGGEAIPATEDCGGGGGVFPRLLQF